MASLKNDDNNVLLSFVMQEYENNKQIPSNVSDFLLDGLLQHANEDVSEQIDESEIEKFSDKFELHIRKIKDYHKCQPKNTKRKDYAYIIKNKVMHFNAVLAKKNKEINESITLLKKLLETKVSLQNKLEEAVIYESAALDLVGVKQKVLLSKVNSNLLNETPQTAEALRKLKAYLDSKKKELEERLEFLEESEAQYKEIQDNPEFLKLLYEYNKLLKQKQLVDIN